MLKQDFIHIMSDSIQNHEGWLTNTGKSFPSNNPGNLHMEGQSGASGAIGSEAKFLTYYDGKQALNNDINAKLGKLNTIRDVITEYAPPSENDTEAYIANVCAFFLSRNIVINPDSPIDAFLSQCKVPLIVIVINQLTEPDDWHAIQSVITECAKFMPEYGFVTRYSDIDISKDVIQVTQAVPPMTCSVIWGTAAKNVIEPYNQGQTMNVLIYSGTVMQGHPLPAGGCEYQGVTIAPVSSISTVMYEGPAFVDSCARVLFHELIHELFWLTVQTDSLHQTLMERGGYQQNLAADLSFVFNGNKLNTPQAIQNLQRSS